MISEIQTTGEGVQLDMLPNRSGSNKIQGESEPNVVFEEGKLQINQAVTSLESTLDEEQFIALKVMLDWLGYTYKGASDFMDASLLTCLNDFQIEQELEITDTFDKASIQEVKQAFEVAIEKPEDRESVKTLTRNLNTFGFGKFIIFDNLGSVAKKKITEFQSFYELPVTQGLNLDMLVKIKELLSNSIAVGDSHDDLILVKTYLNVLGYSDDRIRLTKKFGKRTETSLKRFQKRNKLPVSGRIDQQMKKTLREAISKAANMDKRRNATAKYIKETLNRLGFSGIEVSGPIGSFATQRLIEFQEFYNLTVSGIVDVETLLKFEEILSSPLQINQTGDEILHLKESLISIGYGPIAKTMKFGGEWKEK